MKMKNKNRKGYAYGSMVRKPMYGGGMAMSANPMMDRKDKMGMGSGMMGMAGGGNMKDVPTNNPGLKKLPEDDRNKMGFKAYGGKMKKGKMS